MKDKTYKGTIYKWKQPGRLGAWRSIYAHNCIFNIINCLIEHYDLTDTFKHVIYLNAHCLQSISNVCSSRWHQTLEDEIILLMNRKKNQDYIEEP